MSKKLFLSALCLCFLTAAPLKANEFDDCYEKTNQDDAGYQKCALETARLYQREIEKIYDELSNDRFFEKWNNGNGMYKGNFKTLFDTWVAYRNRYCNLFAFTNNIYDGNDVEYHKAVCLYEMTRAQREQMNSIKSSSQTSMPSTTIDNVPLGAHAHP